MLLGLVCLRFGCQKLDPPRDGVLVWACERENALLASSLGNLTPRLSQKLDGRSGTQVPFWGGPMDFSSKANGMSGQRTRSEPVVRRLGGQSRAALHSQLAHFLSDHRGWGNPPCFVGGEPGAGGTRVRGQFGA